LILSFEDLNQANFLLAKCQNLEKALKEIIRPRAFFANFIHWLTEDSFGTLDQVLFKENKIDINSCIIDSRRNG